MRKQTKLVAVLSTAAVLALGASMTSFAAGWEKDDAGIWHYYDKDDELVTDEWKKDGGKWFYLDEDGDMLTNEWVDDDYYVGEDGAMLVNQWIKTFEMDEDDDPDDDYEHWYYFGSKGKKVTDQDRKINGKTYFFNEDGEMQYGWHEENGYAYYLGDEDDGARAESQWLWLDKSGLNEDDLSYDDDVETVLGCKEDDNCDDEGWYWFQSSGKVYNGSGKKKINGKYYMFNDHGQMLYEWIDNETRVTVGSNAQLDGNLTDSQKASLSQVNRADGINLASAPQVAKLRYYNDVEDGSRANGWYQIDGAKDRGNQNDTDWYYFDNGEVTYAKQIGSNFATYDENGASIWVVREKIDGKYFVFNEEGQMQTGLQYVEADHGFYYFDNNGYQKTGRVANVECDDDDYNFYFTSKNGKNGQGYNGEKDGYLYFNGKRLEADDAYRLYFYNGDVYLTNTKGKIQVAKNGKEFDIENDGIDQDDVKVTTDSKGRVLSISSTDNIAFDGLNQQTSADTDDLITAMIAQLNGTTQGASLLDVTEDLIVSMPFISLYDDDIYTYNKIVLNKDNAGNVVSYTPSEGWVYLNNANRRNTTLTIQ